MAPWARRESKDTLRALAPLTLSLRLELVATSKPSSVYWEDNTAMASNGAGRSHAMRNAMLPPLLPAPHLKVP